MPKSAAIIQSSGLWTPRDVLTNAELVESYNAHVIRYNAESAEAIARGELAEKQPSSSEFIEKASGIQARYAISKEGILDLDRMRPEVALRGDDELSWVAEAGVAAGKDALERAGWDGRDVDGVICSATSMQRPYPAIGIEIQQALGIGGFAYDMSVACSSATFAVTIASNLIDAGQARSLLVISPELTTPQLNYNDRDSNFIFGDAATAVLLVRREDATGGWDILGTKMKTEYSNNIRSNQGFLNRCETPQRSEAELLFSQNGRKVFKEVCPMAAEFILTEMKALGLGPDDMKRLWLHQANVNMNNMVARKVFGRDYEPEEAPIILDEFANTASCGSVIAFHRHHDDFAAGERGVICSFGAGYSIGSIFVEKRAS